LSRGTLIYVVGPSGAGKDTLLAHARTHMSPAAPLAFAHRYITRPADAGGENHVALTEAEFEQRRSRDLFALYWDSHGLRYGVGREIDLWLDTALNVVVNGSRGYFDEAVRRYPDLLPVVITVTPDTLRQRLIARGRESQAEIAERLERARAFTLHHPRLVEIDNSGPLEQSGARFLNVLENA